MKRRRHGPGGLVAALALVLVAGSGRWGSTPVWAAGGRDLPDGWLVGGLAAARALGHPDPVGGWWLTTGATRLYGLPALPVNYLEIGASAGDGLTAAIAWQRTGADLFVEDRLDARVRLGRMRRFGLRLASRRLRLGGESLRPHRSVAVEIGLAADVPAVGRLSGSLFVPLGKAPAWFGRGGRRPLATGTLATPGAAVAIALDRRGDGALVGGLDILMAPAPSLGLTLRLEPAVPLVGTGIVWLARSITIRTSHLVHPHLGVTHRVAVGFGSMGVAPW